MTFNIINFSIAEFHLPPQYKPLLFFNPDMSVKKLNKKRRESWSILSLRGSNVTLRQHSWTLKLGSGRTCTATILIWKWTESRAVRHYMNMSMYAIMVYCKTLWSKVCYSNNLGHSVLSDITQWSLHGFVCNDILVTRKAKVSSSINNSTRVGQLVRKLSPVLSFLLWALFLYLCQRFPYYLLHIVPHFVSSSCLHLSRCYSFDIVISEALKQILLLSMHKTCFYHCIITLTNVSFGVSSCILTQILTLLIFVLI